MQYYMLNFTHYMDLAVIKFLALEHLNFFKHVNHQIHSLVVGETASW